MIALSNIVSGRKGSITPMDASNWRRLRDVNPNLPTSCPQLPMNPVQYRLASRCTKLQADKKVSTTIKRVKVTTGEQNDRPEESPLVIVERKVEMRKRLARLKDSKTLLVFLQLFCQTIL